MKIIEPKQKEVACMALIVFGLAATFLALFITILGMWKQAAIAWCGTSILLWIQIDIGSYTEKCCTHTWQIESTGDNGSNLYRGENLKRKCLKCGVCETGWTQQGRRWDKDGKQVEMHRIHWPTETVTEDRAPNQPDDRPA